MARIAAATSPSASTKWVAPKSRANGSLCASVSTAITGNAPATASPWTALHPTPPSPHTAAVSPRWTAAAFHTEPAPVITPHAIRHADVSGTSWLILTACSSLMTVCSAKADVAAKFEAGCPL
jgi:hypothetical protein